MSQPSSEIPDHNTHPDIDIDTDAIPNPNRSSIDLSMELERQLEADADDQTTLTKQQRLSLDPNVLVHIVTQLRESIDTLNHEKEDLVKQLTESHSRIAEFKDTISLLMERCSTLETDLDASRKKNKDDEEAIVMLRSKVEESRQGLMRLQSERNAENSNKHKRMTLDVNAPARTSWGSPRSANRTSFTPITGSGVAGIPSNLSRRSPSLSINETDPGFAAFVASLPNSPVKAGTDRASRHRSSMYGVPPTDRISPGRVSPASVETESLKRELAAAKAELEETKNELLESNEARDANASCVKALRDYISQLGPADSPTSVSPMNIPKSESKPTKSSGWNLNLLWATTNHDVTTGTKPRAASITSARSAISDDQNAVAQPVPLRSKFGSLFARQTSVSSTSTHPLSSEFNHDEPILNGSDVSSIISVPETSAPHSPPAADKNPSVYIHHEADENTPVPNDRDHVDLKKIPST